MAYPERIKKSGIKDLQIVSPKGKNPNLVAQRGLLLYWKVGIRDSIDVQKEPLDVRIERVRNEGILMPLIIHFTIPYSELPSVIDYLVEKGCNHGKLYPGYGGPIETMKEAKIYWMAKKKIDGLKKKKQKKR